MPEAHILRCLTFFNLCEYSEVNKLVRDFQTTYQPLATEIAEYIKPFAEKQREPQEAYEEFFVKFKRGKIPDSLVRRIEMNHDFESLHRHVRQIEREQMMIRAKKATWRDSSLGVRLNEKLGKDVEKYKRRAGIVFINELAKIGDEVKDLIAQSDIILFEVVNAQKEEYEEKFRNPEEVNIYEDLRYNYATSADYIYWPFTGEYWEDELGYYRYTEKGACKK